MRLNTRGCLLNQLKGKGEGTDTYFPLSLVPYQALYPHFSVMKIFKLYLACSIGLKVSLVLIVLCFCNLM